MRCKLPFLAIALGLFAGTSWAGDMAELKILGFGKDGRVFAFEQFGVQDSSGFPYSNRFYIDTMTDTFLPDTPVRVRLESDASAVEDARSQCRQKGEAILPQTELDAHPGVTAGYNPVTELSANPHRMTVSPRPFFPSSDEPLDFRLEEFPLPGDAACEGRDPTIGFRLMRLDAKSGKAVETLHEDKSIPKSRGCPNGYGIGAVQTFSLDRLSAYAVLISVRQEGFEGPDYRWIAVTKRF